MVTLIHTTDQWKLCLTINVSIQETINKTENIDLNSSTVKIALFTIMHINLDFSVDMTKTDYSQTCLFRTPWDPM